MRSKKKNKEKQKTPREFPNIPFQKEFYQLYLADYFIHKQQTYMSILKSTDKFKTEFLDNFTELKADAFNEFTYSTMLKYEVKSTCFQCIETLFEFIFALEGRNGVIDNGKLWQLLSSSNWKDNYDKIKDISEGGTINLFKSIKINNEIEKYVPLIQYLFYFGIEDSAEIKVQPSLPYIEKILIVLAQYFTDRTVYNMLKHAIRAFPLGKEASAMVHGEVKKINLKDSLTYFSKNDGKYELVINTIDVQRDFHTTVCAAALINNIIAGRREVFKNVQSKGFELSIFTQENVERITKKYVDDFAYKITYKPNRVNN